ncbi:MAG: methyltransferase domain-containing protein [Alphaproteobacteria bacterium]|jgi:hypothetical protein|nr:methyltransferase domain-containing protein [Alphaproteobacteria bacterium]
MNKITNFFDLAIKFKIIPILLFIRKYIYELLSIGPGAGKEMINVGGGIFLRPHWKNMEYSSPWYPMLKRHMHYDVNLWDANFPLEDNSVSFVYSSHTLEHIPQEFCQKILNEMYRVLMPGGALRITVPDFDLLYKAASTNDKTLLGEQLGKFLGPEGMDVDGTTHHDITILEVMLTEIAGERVRKVDPGQLISNFQNMKPEKFADYYTSQASREVQKKNFGFHINWFNENKLVSMFKKAGFSSPYRSTPQGSKFLELRGEGGWLAKGNRFSMDRRLGIDTSHPETSVFVEAVKNP